MMSFFTPIHTRFLVLELVKYIRGALQGLENVILGLIERF